MSFALSLALFCALAPSICQPLFLLAVTRLPHLKGRNAAQFLYAVLTSIAVWIALLVLLPAVRPSGLVEWTTCLMCFGIAALVYLEIWGLLSRGYTLGVLLTLFRAGEPMTPDAIAAAYRGGDGLGWIVRHRLDGLIAAGLLRREGDDVALTQGPGRRVARLQKLCVAILGLRKTG